MKYIVIGINGKELIFTFPKSIDHDLMFEVIPRIRTGTLARWNRELLDAEVISAGFIDNDFCCYGKSETLGVVSRLQQDTVLLCKRGS